jgi:hypothetical protein
MSSYNIQRLPKDVQLEYLKELSPVELISLYNTDKYFNNLLRQQYTINSLIKHYQLNDYDPKITTFKELIIVLFSKLNPKDIYYLYNKYPFIEPYLNDLRITVKFFPILSGRKFPIISDINYDINKFISFNLLIKLIDVIYTFNDINLDDVMNKLNNVYDDPIEFDKNNNKIIMSHFIDLPRTLAYRRNAYRCNSKSLFYEEYLYILEKLGHNVNLYTNKDKYELCNVIINTLIPQQ